MMIWNRDVRGGKRNEKLFQNCLHEHLEVSINFLKWSQFYGEEKLKVHSYPAMTEIFNGYPGGSPLANWTYDLK